MKIPTLCRTAAGATEGLSQLTTNPGPGLVQGQSRNGPAFHINHYEPGKRQQLDELGISLTLVHNEERRAWTTWLNDLQIQIITTAKTLNIMYTNNQCRPIRLTPLSLA
jgi:hypothetical protein